MTTRDIILWTCAYLVELGAVIYFTRATARRVVAALVGGAAAGLLGMGAVALGEARGWWHIPFGSTLSFLPLFLRRPGDLAYANLPRHLATCSPVWLARPGSVHCHCSRHWPAAGLSDCGPHFRSGWCSRLAWPPSSGMLPLTLV
jgi:hypothetical protein